MYMTPASLIPGYRSNIILTDVAGYYLEQELGLRRHKRKAENKTGTLKRQLPILKKIVVDRNYGTRSHKRQTMTKASGKNMPSASRRPELMCPQKSRATRRSSVKQRTDSPRGRFGSPRTGAPPGTLIVARCCMNACVGSHVKG